MTNPMTGAEALAVLRLTQQFFSERGWEWADGTPYDNEALDQAIAAVAELVAAANLHRNKSGRLHDFVSDTIEGGRLTPADIPDDYDAFVLALEEAAVTDSALKAAIAPFGGDS